MAALGLVAVLLGAALEEIRNAIERTRYQRRRAFVIGAAIIGEPKVAEGLS